MLRICTPIKSCFFLEIHGGKLQTQVYIHDIVQQYWSSDKNTRKPNYSTDDHEQADMLQNNFNCVSPKERRADLSQYKPDVSCV